MQQYIIGNWKMNGTKAEAQKLATGFLKRVLEATRPLPHIILCPSYPYLLPVIEILKNSQLEVGAQDAHPESNGAFTGDVSITQLKDVGCKYVIIGHSERRQHYHENSALIQRKIEAVTKAGLKPIYCLGESIDDHKKGKTLPTLLNQLETEIPGDISPHQILVAYEPLWAIGTGVTPTLDEIKDIMGFLKHELSKRITGGALIPLLYGGSVTAKNAAEILDLPHVDGLLVGGASLKLDDFWEIINGSER
jgi:triosephosphate isomerase